MVNKVWGPHLRSTAINCLELLAVSLALKSFFLFLEGRALGVLNLGADLLSRGNPLYGEWKLHPEGANQVWTSAFQQ